MIVYKCDGHSYVTGKKCHRNVENDFPDWWLMIKGQIKNGLPDSHIIQANSEYHFCSRACFISFFFKDENPAGGTASSINMNYTDPNAKQEQTEPAQEAAEQATETTIANSEAGEATDTEAGGE